MRRARFQLAWLAALTAISAGALLPGAAEATNHLTQIDEVMPGAFGRPDLQFVEMRFISCDQNQWSGVARLAFFNATDQEVGQFIFPSNPPSDCSLTGQSVLIATQAYADLPGAPDPDFIMPPLLAPGSGKVCFQGLPGGFAVNLCLSYGDFTGNTEQSSPNNAPTISGQQVCSLRRSAFLNNFGGPNFNADFQRDLPAPRNNAGQTGAVVVPSRFSDVPQASPFLPFIEALFNSGVTSGCGNGAFCPSSTVTRDQMAAFLLLALEGPAFQPPACTSQIFDDVPCSHPFARWINELAARDITTGCGGGNYCPGGAVTREQMAVFLLLTREGPNFSPPACTSPVFLDMPCSSPFAPWVNEIAARGITGGCGNGDFCPENPVTREQMAVFLSTAFGLPVPAQGCQSVVVPPGDDHGNTSQDATPFPIGGPALPGEISAGGDLDVFSFTAQQGQLFILETTDLLQLDPVLWVLDRDGSSILAFDDDGGPGVASRIVFTAPSTGTFFAQVGSFAGASTGSYSLQIQGPIVDDHGNVPATATPLTLDGPTVPGLIAISGDVDVFSFPLAANQSAIVETSGNDPQMITALQILGTDGVTSVSFASTGETPATSRTLITASSSGGTFFARVVHNNGGTGAYGIRVRSLIDDHGNTGETATVLTPETPVRGETTLSDIDFFSFQAQAGQIFVLEVVGLHGANDIGMSFQGPGESNFLDFEFLFGRSIERFTLITETAGTYFLRAQNFSSFNSLGIYQVILHGPIVDDHGNNAGQATPVTVNGPAIAGTHEFAGDVDFFSFSANEGQAFRVRAQGTTSGSFPLVSVFDTDGTTFLSGSGSNIVLVAPRTGKFFAAVVQGSFSGLGSYSLTVTGPLADDHGNLPSLATPLTAGAPALQAQLEFEGDRDFFSFPALAGQTFVFKAEGDALQLRVLGVDGETVLLSSSSFSSEPTRIVFKAPEDGTFFVRVLSSFGEIETYRLSLTGPVSDDHGNTAAEATLLTQGAPPTAGVFEIGGDVDFFAFDATAGESVVLETSSLGSGADTVMDLFGTNGTTLLVSDDDSGGDLASRIVFTPPSTGRFFLRVRHFSSAGTGTYNIAVHTP